MKFTKMQGLGNDYVYLYTNEELPHPGELSVKVSDRHFGIGSDGLIVISPSKTADCKMRIFNADGSEAMMCGNGIRCVGKYVYEHHLTDKTDLAVETKAGIKRLHLHLKDHAVALVSVDMGRSIVEQEVTVTAAGQTVPIVCVNMGNPHAVWFCTDADRQPIERIGQAMQNLPLFMDGINVEFVSVLSKNCLRMRVFERGSGVTMACGTGACASVAAAVSKGYCPPDQTVEVRLDGGSLFVTVDAKGAVTMTGPAETVFEGEMEI